MQGSGDPDLFGAFKTGSHKFKKSKLLSKRSQPSSQASEPVSRRPPQPFAEPLPPPASSQATSMVVEPEPETQALQIVNYSHENGCRQEWIAPAGHKRASRSDAPPAKKFAFELDTFQKVAVDCIERGESVMVAAHTSAGKTAVAQYAIAHALRRGERVVYTSPIKALSNQKYRELDQQFPGEVGLVTGDVSLRQEAAVLIMTTEILRAMLYKGSEVTREMRWVIFDEVHYLRDKERGVVWEETIALLPSASVRLVFLSATVPNAAEFASWVSTIKQHPCSVVATDRRPVPLNHYVEVAGGQGLYLVVDKNGKFHQHNFRAALSILEDQGGPGSTLKDAQNAQLTKKKRGSFGRDDTQGSEVKKVVGFLIDKKLDPAIFFAFSKRECEAHAFSLKSLDKTSDDEKATITRIFQNALQTLADEEQRLPHVVQALELLKRGIGVHHGGLLPIVKEVTEILFQEGLLRVLFTTETFAMGLNMPAKTVVFTSLTKFDGEAQRSLTGSEYIQMSGRAGRRGKDSLGLAVVMLDRRLEPGEARAVFQGSPEKLYSAFTLRFNMLLNLLRLQGVDPLHLLKLSFYHFHATQELPKLRDRLSTLHKEMDEIDLPPEVEATHQSRLETEAVLARTQAEIRDIKLKPEYVIPFCSPGRLIHIKAEGMEFGWGIVIKFYKKRLEPKRGAIAAQGGTEREVQSKIDSLSEVCYVIECFVFVSEHLDSQKHIQPGDIAGRKGELVAMPVTLDCVVDLSQVKMILPLNIKRAEELRAIADTYFDILRRFGGVGEKLPLLDPVKHMHIVSEGGEDGKKLVGLVDREKALLDKLEEMGVEEGHAVLLRQKAEKKQAVDEVQKEVRAMEKVGQQEQLKSMMRVLRRLDFVSKEGVVQLKGRVACEISSADQVLVTELMFSNSFKQLDPPTVASLLSCFVAKEIRETNAPPQDEELKQAFLVLQKEAERVGQVMVDARMLEGDDAGDEYVKQFKPDLMGITYAWCAKTPFSEILSTTELYEGTIIRCLRRLAELLKQLGSAAKAIGTGELHAKFEAAREALSHGIVFVASLYIS